jgi:hypothetical protein
LPVWEFIVMQGAAQVIPLKRKRLPPVMANVTEVAPDGTMIADGKAGFSTRD